MAILISLCEALDATGRRSQSPLLRSIGATTRGSCDVLAGSDRGARQCEPSPGEHNNFMLDNDPYVNVSVQYSAEEAIESVAHESEGLLVTGMCGRRLLTPI